ncbi:MAG: RcnB family protein, partial [Hyphomicrobium sp.]|nr:RcnB family protein [Hyphomicrobium sp.]
YQQQAQQPPQQPQHQGSASRNERVQRYQQRAQLPQIQGQSIRNDRPERYRQRQLEASQQAQGGALVPRQSRIRPIPSTGPEAGQAGPVRHDVRSGRRYDRDDRNRWSNHWRNDRRYDWRSHRDRNRSIFRIGFYYDPFGYSYRRFGIGSFLYSNYYQSNYWINDPWQYRLPPAYGAYRWVRYHNDALLIDTYSGEVVDVIYGFFW